jgi:hypothetical protein
MTHACDPCLLLQAPASCHTPPHTTPAQHFPHVPRVQVLERGAALDLLKALLLQLSEACGIVSVTSYSQLKRFVEAVARQQWRALARSALHLQLSSVSWQGKVAPAWAPSAEMLCVEAGLPLAGGGAGASSSSVAPPCVRVLTQC